MLGIQINSKPAGQARLVGSHWRLSNFTNAAGIQVGLLYYRILPMDAPALRAVWKRAELPRSKHHVRVAQQSVHHHGLLLLIG
jgi:hypothetical protein